MNRLSCTVALLLLSTPSFANTSLSGIVAPELVAKVREIQSACGSHILSTRDRRGNRSNHPIGRAVDMAGNPSCIYAHLKSWPGGVSTDYGSVHHVHISYNPGGQEWGLRFRHGVRSRGVRRSQERGFVVTTPAGDRHIAR